MTRTDEDERREARDRRFTLKALAQYRVVMKRALKNAGIAFENDARTADLEAKVAEQLLADRDILKELREGEIRGF